VQYRLRKQLANPFLEHKLYDVSAEVARALHAKGIGKSEPTPFTEEDIKKYFGGVRFIYNAIQLKNAR
jgi:hypothetical protein